MYGYIYRTHFDNGRYKYIGQKKSETFLGERYLGSGADYFQNVKNKYKDTAVVELLEECDSKEQLNEREKYWIKFYNAVEDSSYLNIHEGGKGGDTISGLSSDRYLEFIENCKISQRGLKKPDGFQNGNNKGHGNLGKKFSKERLKKFRKIMSSDEHRRKMSRIMKGKLVGRTVPIEVREKIAKSVFGENNPFYGKKHSEESRRKMSESKKGENNPVSGKVWITNGESNKMIDKKELELYLSNGWQKGRTVSELTRNRMKASSNNRERDKKGKFI